MDQKTWAWIRTTLNPTGPSWYFILHFRSGSNSFVACYLTFLEKTRRTGWLTKSESWENQWQLRLLEPYTAKSSPALFCLGLWMSYQGPFKSWLHCIYFQLALSISQTNENDRVPPTKVVQDYVMPLKKYVLLNAAGIAQPSGQILYLQSQ